MTDRDLAAREQADSDAAARRGQVANPGEDGERVTQPGDLDLSDAGGDGIRDDRIRDDQVAGDPVGDDEVRDDRVRGDRVRDDRVRDDRVRDDRVRDDQVIDDRIRDDQVRDDRIRDDRVRDDYVGDDRVGGDGVVGGQPATVDERPATAVVEEPTTVVRPRASGAAVFGALLAAIGLCGALTGLLAPEAFVVAVIAGLVCLGAFGGIARRPIAGGGVATVGLIISLAAIVIAVLAMTKQFSWPNSGVDEVSRWHDWLVAHWSWLGRWT